MFKKYPSIENHYQQKKKQTQIEKPKSFKFNAKKYYAGDSSDAQCAAEKWDIEKDGFHDKIDSDGCDGQKVFSHPKAWKSE